MKITVIELLNKMASDEELPSIIRYQDYDYKYNKRDKDYQRNDGLMLLGNMNIKYCLNDEIEIISEPKEELEEIELLNTPYTKSQNDFAVENKINELIENQKKIIRELKANKVK